MRQWIALSGMIYVEAFQQGAQIIHSYKSV